LRSKLRNPTQIPIADRIASFVLAGLVPVTATLITHDSGGHKVRPYPTKR